MLNLKPWQPASADKLEQSLAAYKVACDTSDPGTGKTYVAAEVIRRTNTKPLVLVPKSGITGFQRVMEQAGIEPHGVLNIEKLKTGKTPWLAKQGRDYRWTAPSNTLLVFDEAHGYGGINSDNGKIMALAKAYGYPVLMMSATMATSPLRMRAPGYLLNLHEYRMSSYYTWCKKLGCYNSPFVLGKLEFPTGPSRLAHLQTLHDAMAPYTSRVRIADVPDFPECDIQPKLYDLDKDYTDEINKIYAEMNREIASPNPLAPSLVLKMRARQRVELVKVPLLADLVEEIIEENRSAVVFMNFREPLELLTKALDVRGISSVQIYGQDSDRQMKIDLFQNSFVRVILVMSQAGGVSISLHDVNGDYPRTALLTPSVVAEHMKQCLGRIWRADGKSKAVQQFVLAAGTEEENVYRNLLRKIANINTINDGFELEDRDLDTVQVPTA